MQSLGLARIMPDRVSSSALKIHFLSWCCFVVIAELYFLKPLKPLFLQLLYLVSFRSIKYSFNIDTICN